MAHRPRRSFEPGHRLKFLVVVDGAEEAGKAARYAARRAIRADGALAMLHVIDSRDFNQWLGVGDLMRQEAEARAQTLLDAQERACLTLGALTIERHVRFGEAYTAILSLIEEDEDIAYLVLAAGAGPKGPGPLVSAIAGGNAHGFPVPLVIVPGALEDCDIDALA
jgi:nucleotide-binding universal stress UspA family protein